MEQLQDDDHHPLIDGVKEQWNKEQQADFSSMQDFCPSRRTNDVTLENLTEELESIALEWKSVRTAIDCPCSTPLDFSSFKVRFIILHISINNSNGDILFL